MEQTTCALIDFSPNSSKFSQVMNNRCLCPEGKNPHPNWASCVRDIGF